MLTDNKANALQWNARAVFYFFLAGIYFFINVLLYYQTLHNLAFSIVETLTELTILTLVGSFILLVLIPRLLHTGRIFSFSIFFILISALSTLTIDFIFRRLFSHFIEPLSAMSGFTKQIIALLNLMTILGSLCFIKLYFDNKDKEQKLKDAEMQRNISELKYLKAQLNPHFIFNSLNTIFFQIDKSNELARTTLSSFAELLRYHLSASEKDTVTIKDEFEYIRHYVNLKTERMSKPCAVNLSLQNEPHDFFIAPLLFIPLIENAFKFVSTSSENYITINAFAENEWFTFQIINSTDSEAGNNVKSTNIGIPNLQKRLAILYPEKHKIQIINRPDSFEVIVLLTLPL